MRTQYEATMIFLSQAQLPNNASDESVEVTVGSINYILNLVLSYWLTRS